MNYKDSRYLLTNYINLIGSIFLGCSHHVYPGARHSRFEHSIGVMHLAEKFVATLQDNYPGRNYYFNRDTVDFS